MCLSCFSGTLIMFVKRLKINFNEIYEQFFDGTFFFALYSLRVFQIIFYLR